jgi:hypothetical protein
MAQATKTVDTISAFKSIAMACAAHDGSENTVQTHIAVLVEGEIKFGKSKKTCQYRVQMNDAFKVAYPGKAAKTYSNYVTGIVDAVNNGVKFSFSSSKGKAKAKADADKTIFPILAKLFGHAGFPETMQALQEAFENDEGVLTDIIADMLKAEGYEIKD